MIKYVGFTPVVPNPPEASVLPVSKGLSELSEYILCNGSAVDSWSYGTKEHYQEALADLISLLLLPHVVYLLLMDT